MWIVLSQFSKSFEVNNTCFFFARVYHNQVSMSYRINGFLGDFTNQSRSLQCNSYILNARLSNFVLKSPRNSLMTLKVIKGAPLIFETTTNSIKLIKNISITYFWFGILHFIQDICSSDLSGRRSYEWSCFRSLPELPNVY